MFCDREMKDGTYSECTLTTGDWTETGYSTCLKPADLFVDWVLNSTGQFVYNKTNETCGEDAPSMENTRPLPICTADGIRCEYGGDEYFCDNCCSGLNHF